MNTMSDRGYEKSGPALPTKAGYDTPNEDMLRGAAPTVKPRDEYTEIPSLLNELEKRLESLEEATSILISQTSPVARFDNDEPQEDVMERETFTELGSVLVRALYIAERTQRMVETHTKRIQL